MPAATTTTLPAATALFTDWLMPSFPSDAVEVPRLIEITRTLGRAAHQSMPAITCAIEPEPAEFRTFAADSPAPGATPPYLDASPPPVESPVAIAATCVPWPWSSYAVGRPATASKNAIGALPSSCS